MKPSHIIVPALAVFFFSFSLLLSPANASDTCEEALEAKCADCHHLSRVCQKLGKKNKKRWKRTIKRMVKRGAVLSKDEKNILLSCLAEQKEGTKTACNK